MFDFLVRLLNIEEEKMRLFNIENFSNSSAVAGTIYKRQKNSDDVDSLVGSVIETGFRQRRRNT